MKKIHSSKPDISNKDVSYAIDAIKNGWNEKRSDYLNLLSNEFSKFLRIKYCLPLDHGTSAIHLALIALNIKKGDEVIVPDLTWVASASPIIYVGAKPVFCDIDKKSLCLTVDTIKQCISKKTKAIIAVDLYGGSPDWTSIKNFCRRNNIKIIEDSAESLGCYYKNKPIGSFGDVNIFSFQATKLLSSGLGGMFCTDRKDLHEKALLYHHHGISGKSGKYYWADVVGYNYQMTNLQASIVLSQLRKIKKLLKKKREIYLQYKKKLKGEKKINFAYYDSKDLKHSHWMTIIFLEKRLKLTKEKIVEIGKKYQIEFRPIFYPLTSMPAFKKFKKNRNTTSYEISKYGICLPCGNNMNLQKINRVCSVLKKIVNKEE